MKIRKAEVEKFFNLYDSRFNEALLGNSPDVDGVINSFAENFIEANPLGVFAARNDATFKEAIPKGWDFYKQIGVTAMTIVKHEVTILDDFHAMDKVYWKCTYELKGSKGAIDFAVHYFVQKLTDQLKIFAYITGDEQKALKDHGLV